MPRIPVGKELAEVEETHFIPLLANTSDWYYTVASQFLQTQQGGFPVFLAPWKRLKDYWSIRENLDLLLPEIQDSQLQSLFGELTPHFNKLYEIEWKLLAAIARTMNFIPPQTEDDIRKFRRKISQYEKRYNIVGPFWLLELDYQTLLPESERTV